MGILTSAGLLGLSWPTEPTSHRKAGSLDPPLGPPTWSQNPMKFNTKSLLFFIELCLFLKAPAKARTLDLIGRGETFMGSGFFDQDPKNHAK